MALSHRPGTVRDGLIYYHDTGNKASFKGKPTVNLCPIDLSNPSWVAEGSAYTRELQPQKLFGQPVYRFQSNPAKIWESAFRFDGADVQTQDTTISAYFYNVTGETSNVNMYYGKDFSLDSNGDSNYKVIPSDGKWHRVSWTMYAGVPQSNIIEFRTHHPNLLISCPQIEVGRFPTPLVDGERTVTNSLLDMMGNLETDVTNMSFSPQGLDFDGTDDYIRGQIDPSYLQGSYSIETVFKHEGTSTWEAIWSNNAASSNWSNTDKLSPVLTFHGSYPYQIGHNAVGQSPNGVFLDLTADHMGKYVYVCLTRSNTTINIYAKWENTDMHTVGEYTDYDIIPRDNFLIGRHWYNSGNAGQSFNGEIPILKIYNKALTAEEINQNFNLIKDRFAL